MGVNSASQPRARSVEVRVINNQRRYPINGQAIERLALCSLRRLGIKGPGFFEITFITEGAMRVCNRRFMQHDWVTDVLSFRYAQEKPSMKVTAPVIGEILIAPGQARAYAQEHGILYAQELARYVVHGLLHWHGYDDATAAQQQRMRRMETTLMKSCGIYGGDFLNVRHRRN